MNTTANTATTTTGLTKPSGFSGKHHDLATKNRISQTQKARYNYMRQMVKQTQESKEYGPIDIDSPTFAERIKSIVREVLREEIKNSIPTRQNIPIF